MWPNIYLKTNVNISLLNVRILTNKPFEMANWPVYFLQSGRRNQPFSGVRSMLPAWLSAEAGDRNLEHEHYS
jgi:hypothetical protein